MVCLLLLRPRREDRIWPLGGLNRICRLRLRILLQLRLPAALPAFCSGLRVATAIAPIGAVLGEWVGASSGLGYVMINANARIQTGLMFAALGILAAMTITLYVLVDWGIRRVLTWAPGG